MPGGVATNEREDQYDIEIGNNADDCGRVAVNMTRVGQAIEVLVASGPRICRAVAMCGTTSRTGGTPAGCTAPSTVEVHGGQQEGCGTPAANKRVPCHLTAAGPGGSSAVNR
jgi:hypothetical protein